MTFSHFISNEYRRHQQGSSARDGRRDVRLADRPGGKGFFIALRSFVARGAACRVSEFKGAGRPKKSTIVRRKGSSLQSYRCVFSAVMLSTAMAFGVTAMAADLPKEGTFNATHSTFGTVKVTTIGKERAMFVFDENGLTRSDGLLDRTTSHCWGMAQFVNGVGAPYGSCVVTDPDGDQISIDFIHEKWHTPNEKNVHASATITAGTGKYTGITGGWTYVAHVNEFRTAVEGTYAADVTTSGSYKLP